MNNLRVLARRLHTSRPVASEAHRAKALEVLRAKQKHFQVNNGVPIYLKGGNGDLLVYYSNIVLQVVGVTMMLDFLYHSAFPKK